MPEGNNALAKRFQSAVSAVEARWWHLSVRPERISAKELAAYRKHKPVVGWRFDVEFSDKTRRLDVFVATGFPFVPARIALVDHPEFLSWPHIERDGVLCLMSDHATVSVDDPYGAIMGLLDLAHDLIEGFVRSAYDDEFRSEFLSYWTNSQNVQDRTVLSLMNPAPPSRTVKIWDGGERIVIADNDEQLQAWLQNFSPCLTAAKRCFRDAVLVWLDKVPLPSQYPSTAKDVYEIAASAGAAKLLDGAARDAPDHLFVALGALTENGPAVVATLVRKPPVVRGSDLLKRGFRPSRLPEPVLKARFFGAAAAGKNSVDRVDAEWIHGRDRDLRIARLRKATVAVLGCGSVGAPVAVNLAHAGVGKLILVDRKKLKGANVGRHPLGVRSIDMPKASELAQRLRSDLPHIEVVSQIEAVQDLLLRPDNPLAKVDLIVSALGDWPGESMLDEWHVANGKIFPIVYGWTEPHAAAGHAVIISSSDGRLRDGLNSAGQPLLVATQWLEDTRRYEPACGAAFEPYGPVELGFITSLVSEAALDCLLGTTGAATHRIWLARRKFLENAGGEWSKAIRDFAPQAVDGGIALERRWGQDQFTKVLAA